METIKYSTETKAIKDHICDLCHSKIEKSSIYLKSVHKIDDIFTCKYHKKCEQLCLILKMDEYDDEGVDSNLFMDIIEETYDNLFIENIDIFHKLSYKKPNFQEQLKSVFNYYKI